MFKEKQCENNGKVKKANWRDFYNQNHIRWLSRFMSVDRSHYSQEARNLNHREKCSTNVFLCPPIKLILYCKCTTCKLELFVSKCHLYTWTLSESPGVVAENTDHKMPPKTFWIRLSLGHWTQECSFLTSWPPQSHPQPKTSVLALQTWLLLSP